MSSNTPSLCRLCVALCVALATAFAGARTPQDIPTSSGVFISRPSNPPVRRRARRVKKGTGAAQAGRRRRAGEADTQAAPSKPAEPEDADPETEKEEREKKEKEEAAAFSPNDRSDAVEDALFLGNSARDSDPPRLEEAERAYRLALKLDRDDPRPHVGLANIYYDRKQFEKAAAEYRAALNVQDSNKEKAEVAASEAERARERSLLRKSRKRTKGRQVERRSVGHHAAAPPSIRLSSPEGRWRFYLASTLIQLNRAEEAGDYLRYLRPEGGGDALWNATLAAYLAGLKRYGEAARLAEKAASLAPDSAAYKTLSETIRARSAEAESLSAATAKALEGTTWVMGTRAEAVCELRSGGELRCQYNYAMSRPFRQGKWKTEGDLLHLFDLEWPGDVHCVGTVKTKRIDFGCGYSDDYITDWGFIWVKK
jgi:tetratricopeptide (TPR) repeat protein